MPEVGGRAGCKLGVSTMHPPPLPYNERCFEPHERLLGWEIMHMWVQGEWMGVTSIVHLVRSRTALAKDRFGLCWHGVFMYTYKRLSLPSSSLSFIHSLSFPLLSSQCRSSLCLLSSNHISLEELPEIRLSCVPASEAALYEPADSTNSQKRSVVVIQ